MKKLSHPRLFIILLIALISQGCSTIITASSAEPGTPKIYSGTRLNIETLRNNKNEINSKYKVDPPKHPLIDMPFSIALDTFILPLTFPVATYEMTIGKLEEKVP